MPAYQTLEEAFKELNRIDLKEASDTYDENLFANYCSSLAIFNDILENQRILTNFNQKNARDFDFRGNHICLTHNILNPPSIMQYLNFGIAISKDELENYINDEKNSDKIRKVSDFGISNMLNKNAVADKALRYHPDSHFRRIRSLAGKKNKAEGMYITGIKRINGIYYIRFLNWSWREVVMKGFTEARKKTVDEFFNFIKELFDQLYTIQQKQNTPSYKFSTEDENAIETAKNTLKSCSLEPLLKTLLEKEADSKAIDWEAYRTYIKDSSEQLLVEKTLTLTKTSTDIITLDKKLRQLIFLIVKYSVRLKNYIKNNGDAKAREKGFNIVNWKGLRACINSEEIGDKQDAIKLKELGEFLRDSGSAQAGATTYTKIYYWSKNNIPISDRLFINKQGTSDAEYFKSKYKFDDTSKYKVDNGENYIYCIGGDTYAGLNSYLSSQTTAKKNCIELTNELTEDGKEITKYKLPAANISGTLDEEYADLIDNSILNEDEFRLYTPEVAKEYQNSTAYDYIENAFFAIDKKIVKKIILPEVYGYYDDNNKNTPKYKFRLIDWIESDLSNKFDLNMIEQFILDAYKSNFNKYAMALRNDLIDLYKNLKDYKKEDVKIVFYSVNDIEEPDDEKETKVEVDDDSADKDSEDEVQTVPNDDDSEDSNDSDDQFRARETKYVSRTSDPQNTDYSDYIRDEQEIPDKEIDLSSRDSKSYKMLGYAGTDTNHIKQINPNGVKAIQYTKGSKEDITTHIDKIISLTDPITNKEMGYARVQVAVLVYHRDTIDYSTASKKDILQHTYILLYSDNGHLDIPHTGIQNINITEGIEDDPGVKKVNSKKKSFKEIVVSLLNKEAGDTIANNINESSIKKYKDYYYQESSSFLKDVNLKAGYKWKYYYNLLYSAEYPGKIDLRAIYKGTGTERGQGCRWMSLYDYYISYKGRSSHIGPIIYNCLVEQGIIKDLRN